MLDDALEVVRTLVDGAIEAEEASAAAKLSRLASTLEKAVSFQQQIADQYIARAEIDRETIIIVETYCQVAETILLENDFAAFEAIMSGALPAEIPDDDHVFALRKEREQVEALFASAVEAALVGDIVRIGSLLVLKSKALTRAEIRAGVLLDASGVRLLSQPILDANKAARKAIGADLCDRVVDALLLRFGRSSDGT